MIFTRLFRTAPGRTPQRRLYEQIVAQARQPWFYAAAGVPDTLDGRFDMIVLHAFLVFDRLGGETAEAREFAQLVFDEMFKDMDRSLREMGVSDVSVGPKVRRMAEVFYGRSRAYSQAVGEEEDSRRQALLAALARNIFAGATDGDVAALADYALEVRQTLARQPVALLLSGEVGFGPATPS